ncbi:4Fe-4S binding protein [bacterium]|nr:4Fe-4S binding protein [candidate division CSSED10-310 bacterium]
MSQTTDKKRKIKEIRIKTEWCKGCGICVDICPKQVLAMDYMTPVVVSLGSCIACGLCEINCPDFCLEVILEESDR